MRRTLVSHSAPYPDSDERELRGIPANIGHESDTSILLMAEWSRRNSDALVLSATGNDLDEDLPVSVGHRHDERAASIDWQASQSLAFTSGVGTGVGGDGFSESYHVVATSSERVGVGWIQMPLIADGTEGLYTSLRWRVRADVPGPGGISPLTFFVTLGIAGPEAPTTLLVTSQLARSSPVETGGDVWFEGPPIMSAALRSLQDAEDGVFLVYVYAHVDTSAVALYEVQLQWGPQ
jgi:hypothetical protein